LVVYAVLACGHKTYVHKEEPKKNRKIMKNKKSKRNENKKNKIFFRRREKKSCMRILHSGKYLEFNIMGTSLYIKVKVSHKVQYAHVRLQLYPHSR
jgi:penicillin-binding protein-related factor A (putative recombinase)